MSIAFKCPSTKEYIVVEENKFSSKKILRLTSELFNTKCRLNALFHIKTLKSGIALYDYNERECFTVNLSKVLKKKEIEDEEDENFTTKLVPDQYALEMCIFSSTQNQEFQFKYVSGKGTNSLYCLNLLSMPDYVVTAGTILRLSPYNKTDNQHFKMERIKPPIMSCFDHLIPLMKYNQRSVKIESKNERLKIHGRKAPGAYHYIMIKEQSYNIKIRIIQPVYLSFGFQKSEPDRVTSFFPSDVSRRPSIWLIFASWGTYVYWFKKDKYRVEYVELPTKVNLTKNDIIELVFSKQTDDLKFYYNSKLLYRHSITKSNFDELYPIFMFHYEFSKKQDKGSFEILNYVKSK